jgi:hypothetical protein
VNWHPNFQHKSGKLAGWEVMASKQFYRMRRQACPGDRSAAQAEPAAGAGSLLQPQVKRQE